MTVVVAVLAAIFARWTFARMDRLAGSLEARNAEVEARAASANALHAVSQAIASLADLDEILGATVDSARALLSADLALLVLIGADGEPTLRATSGPDVVVRSGRRRAGRRGGALPAPAAGDRDARRPASPWRHDDRHARGGRAQRRRATTWATSRRSRRSPARRRSRSRTTGSQAELRALAVRHERERIAREMHDGLAQVLGYVNTKSQAVESLLEAGRLDEAMAPDGRAERGRALDATSTSARPSSDSPNRSATTSVSPELRDDYARRFAEASKLAVVGRTMAPGARGDRPRARGRATGVRHRPARP